MQESRQNLSSEIGKVEPRQDCFLKLGCESYADKAPVPDVALAFDQFASSSFTSNSHR